MKKDSDHITLLPKFIVTRRFRREAWLLFKLIVSILIIFGILALGQWELCRLDYPEAPVLKCLSGRVR